MQNIQLSVVSLGWGAVTTLEQGTQLICLSRLHAPAAKCGCTYTDQTPWVAAGCAASAPGVAAHRHRCVVPASAAHAGVPLSAAVYLSILVNRIRLGMTLTRAFKLCIMAGPARALPAALWRDRAPVGGAPGPARHRPGRRGDRALPALPHLHQPLRHLGRRRQVSARSHCRFGWAVVCMWRALPLLAPLPLISHVHATTPVRQFLVHLPACAQRDDAVCGQLPAVPSCAPQHRPLYGVVFGLMERPSYRRALFLGPGSILNPTPF